MCIGKIIKKIIIPSLITPLLLTPATANDDALIYLPDKRFAVMSVGDLESESMGSYSIAIFKDKNLSDFETGTVLSREGLVFDYNNKPRITFADINGDGSEELIVSKLSVGNTNHLEVDALEITDQHIKLLTRIYINGRNDPIQSLRALCKRNQCPEQSE
ncbi:hypothetical protein ID852_00380 [Xenorhabdus sp. 42]|uniref:PliI family lysozyme inhibitor of I-type lysozyme n=1 Tax=Xenorhabdus szentirmaii TaxID=290112 RepID=UPI00199D9623|nr:PliI family lysozyme inhibitor of I-type lysozyme [Xenorhabdus sp. 42]MBD2819173.1 hypothetical protein [Xenorhabdus sp. 42]